MIPINVGLYCVPHASQGHGENSNPSSFSRPSLNTSRVRQPPRPYAAKMYHRQGYTSLIRGPAVLYCVSRNVVRDRELNLMFVKYIISDIALGRNWFHKEWGPLTVLQLHNCNLCALDESIHVRIPH